MAILIRIITIIALTLLAACTSNDASRPAADTDVAVEPAAQEPRRFVVQLAHSQSEATLTDAADKYFGANAAVEALFAGIDDDELARIFLVTARPADAALSAWDAAYAFQAEGNFERVEPDRSDTLEAETRRNTAAGACFFDGNNPNPDLAWSLRKLNVEAAWQLTPPAGGKQFGEGVKICHPDTGWTEHDDLDSLDLAGAWNVIDGNADARDPKIDGVFLNPGHGTATGSVIGSDGGIAAGAGTTPPGKITGVAPAATLVPIRTVNSVIQFFDSDVAKAVAHSVNAKCDVVSMSLGGRAFFGLKSAVRYAVRQGLIVVAASGNCVGMVVAPALYDETIAVAATNDQDTPWKGSSHGRKITISAPGENVWTADNRSSAHTPQNISASNGTSFATAETAGAAALWLAFHGRTAIEQAAAPGHVQDLFVRLVQDTARTPAGWDAAHYGPGIVDVHELLQASLTPPAPAATAAAAFPANESVQLLADLTDRNTAEIERAMRVMLGEPGDFDAAIDRWAPELIDVALRDPNAFQRSIDAALTPPADPTDGRPRVQARSAIDGLVSDALRSAIR
jgi:hypothetical protein